MSNSSDPIVMADSGLRWRTRIVPLAPPITVSAGNPNLYVEDRLTDDEAKALSVRIGAAAVQVRVGEDRDVFAEAERLLAEHFDQAVQELLAPAEPEAQPSADVRMDRECEQSRLTASTVAAMFGDGAIKVGDRVVVGDDRTAATVTGMGVDVIYDDSREDSWPLDRVERVEEAQATAPEREKVRVDATELRVGDMLDGKRIIGFGTSAKNGPYEIVNFEGGMTRTVRTDISHEVERGVESVPEHHPDADPNCVGCRGTGYRFVGAAPGCSAEKAWCFCTPIGKANREEAQDAETPDAPIKGGDLVERVDAQETA